MRGIEKVPVKLLLPQGLAKSHLFGVWPIERRVVSEICIDIGAWNTYMMLEVSHCERDEDLQWRACALVSRDKTNAKIDRWRISKDGWWLIEGELKVKGGKCAEVSNDVACEANARPLLE
jgi:hypothetical protein